MYELPSRYWEPQPDEEDIIKQEERLQEEYEERIRQGLEVDEELPFE